MGDGDLGVRRQIVRLDLKLVGFGPPPSRHGAMADDRCTGDFMPDL